MSAMTNQPADYSIEGLLSTGVQPFPDLPEEDLRELGKGIGKGQLAIPISVTSDGLLVDGHQRLKAMLSQGRRTIAAGDVRVIEAATAENALDWSIRLNAARRHLTGAQKAELARYLQRTRRWSQGRVAKAFGVARPAVSQWLANYPAPDGEQPTFVIGEDGKEYDLPERPAVDKAPRHPWDPAGPAFKALRKAARALEANGDVVGLDAFDLAKLDAENDRLIEAALELRLRIEAES
jgi:transcriptional regulator with XRE-family HTH domain